MNDMFENESAPLETQETFKKDNMWNNFCLSIKDGFIGETLYDIQEFLTDGDRYERGMRFLVTTIVSLFIAAIVIVAINGGTTGESFQLREWKHILTAVIIWLVVTLLFIYFLVYGDSLDTPKEKVHKWAKFQIYGAMLAVYGTVDLFIIARIL